MTEFFPIECSDNLHAIGLLVKSRRLQTKQRQKDLARALGVSERSLRKIESGDPSVELRSFMLVLGHLGLTGEVFRSLEQLASSSQFQVHDPRAAVRVRLPKPKGEF